VVVDSERSILSTGYNGVARGVVHCTDHPCAGVSCPSGTGLDACEAIHAEINALIRCADVSRAHTVYVTVTPCVSCVKALLSSNCRRIVAAARYPHPEAQALWQSAGREWVVASFNRAEDAATRYKPIRELIGAGLALSRRK